MRILHVANFNTRRYGTDLYATDRKISAGLIRNGHFVYDFSYRDVSRNESLFKTTKLGSAKVNRCMLQACDILRPELVLLGHSELVESSTLGEIKKRYPSTRIGLWYVDALFHKEKTRHVFNRLPHIDVFFATTAGRYLQEYSSATTSAVFIPNMVDPAVESKKSFQATRHEHDFIFCGRDSSDPQRQSFMEKLQEETAKHLRCSFRGCLGHKAITGYDYLEFLSQSKMALNISRRNDAELYSSDRLMQLTGNGLITFCPEVPGMESLFTDQELVYFDGFDDLIDKILYYHQHDDKGRAIAERGWQRAHRCYTSDTITRYMVERLFDLPLTSDYTWQNAAFITPMK